MIQNRDIDTRFQQYGFPSVYKHSSFPNSRTKVVVKSRVWKICFLSPFKFYIILFEIIKDNCITFDLLYFCTMVFPVLFYFSIILKFYESELTFFHFVV